MATLRLRVASGESLIDINANIIDACSLALQRSHKVIIVTDANVGLLYQQLFTDITKTNQDKQFYTYTLPASEKAKTLATHNDILNLLAELGFTRSDCILSIGGGVVSDIAGFCAATYMRGIRFVSIPTTLLAMVDAAIGGKCGVNLEKGKNLAGCFYQPEVILVNANFLHTLEQKEFNCGIAEIIKYAVIADSTLFSLLDDAQANINELIYKSIAIKKAIVEADERENLERMKLNFGHTIGHIAEKVGEYSKYTHGEAIAYGMRMEAKLLKVAGLADDKGIISKYLDKFDLTAMPRLTKDIITQHLFLDKKMRGDNLYFAGFDKVGTGKVFKFSKALMLDYLDMLFMEEDNGNTVRQ